MDEMIGYVVKNLETAEENIVKIAKTLKAQKGVNFRLTGMALFSVASIIVMGQHIKILTERIETLNDEIEELRNEKEE